MGPRRGRLVAWIALSGAGIFAAVVALGLLNLNDGSDEPSPTREDRAGTLAEETSGQPFLGCTDCHQDLDEGLRGGQRPDLLYTHEEHFLTGVADCSACHPAQTHVGETIRKPTMGRCFSCHGTADTAMASGACTTCHPPGLRNKPPSHSTPDWASGAHAQPALEDHSECLACHNTEGFCTSCHGIEMPHAQDWAKTPHIEAFFDLGVATCERCHPRSPEIRDSCDSCHHPFGPDDAGWRTFHPTALRRFDAGGCFDCHAPATCAACHERGRETFENDRLRVLPVS